MGSEQHLNIESDMLGTTPSISIHIIKPTAQDTSILYMVIDEQ